MDEVCKAHFEGRIKDFEKSVGSAAMLASKLSNTKDSSVNTILILQFVVSLIGGVLIPLIIAFYWWRNKDLTKFPVGNFLVLMLVSCFLLFFLPLPLAGLAASYVGDNPKSSGGITLGWIVTVLFFWPSLRILHYRLKKGKKVI